MDYPQFLDPTVDRTLALSGVYNPILVAVSVLMAVVAAYAALGLAGRVKAAENRRTRQLWLAAGAAAMGTGVWAMHFIGMLAFRLPIGVAYDLGMTLLSVAPAVVASSIVLYVASRAEIRFPRLVFAGTMMGLGIGVMHYTGMAAMRMAADMYYDRLLFGVSLIVAAGLATAALRIHFLAGKGGERQSWRLRFAAAVTMGSAVAGMHYTAMAAAYFFPSSGRQLPASAFDPTVLAVLVGLAAAVIMVFAIFVVVIDTRLKAAAHSVRTSQARMMHAIESISEGLSLYDAQDRLVLCNSKFLELLRPEDKDVIGETFENLVRRRVERDLIPRADKGAEEWIAQRLAEHRNPSGPNIQQRSNGRWLQINERKTEDGGTVAIYTDITASKEAEQRLQAAHDDLDRRVHERTKDLQDANAALQAEIEERKRAEEALHKSREQAHEQLAELNNLYRTAPVGLCLLDTELRYVRINERLAAMNGKSVEEHIGHSLDEVIPEAARELESVYQRVIETGEALFGVEVTTATPAWTGTVLVSYCPVKTGDGTVVGVSTVVQDITERKRAEERQKNMEAKLQQAQKLESLGVLAGGVAHDFNNLLMGMLGNAEIAQLQLTPEAPARERIENIVKAALRAAELTRQMLAYSGKGKFVVQALDLSRLVEEMAHLLQVSISKTVVLKYNFAANLPAIEADASQIHQIVMNLIINASEAIGRKSGVVTVSTSLVEADRSYLAETYLDENLPEGYYVSLEVADTGCGMDKQTLQKIFDPFFTTKFTGRGLGLAAVLGIVRGHGGALKIYSEPRRGTTFKVLFPASRQTAEKSAGTSAAEQAWRGSGAILVVDDEETVRIATKMMLETLGFTVLTTEDGREALEVFRSRGDEIVLVLLDLTMPHLDGEETFRELRRIRSDVRVILSSGYNEQETTSRFAGKGLAGFIQKPYGIRQLGEKIRQGLEAPPETDRA